MKRLLLVDDELAIVDTLTFLLELEGYEVVSAANGRDGLQKLREAHVDLVIVDVMMPILGGIDMLRMARAMPEHEATPAILISAAPQRAIFRANDVRVDESADARLFQLFLQKPFDLVPLLSAIQRLIGPGEPSPDQVGT